MSTLLKPLVYLGVAWMITGAAAAQDTGAMASGNWTDPTIWTTGVIPVSSNNVYIGSTIPTGAASSATVTISSADELASNLYLGFGSGTNGTLDLTGHKVIVNNTLSIGQGASAGVSGGTGSIVESSGGSFQTKNLEIHSGNLLTFGASDVATNVLVDSASTLNLGATTKFTGILDVRDTGSVVNLNGNSLTATDIYLGYNNNQTGGAVTLNRGSGGTLTATDLYLGNGTSLSLVAGDKVTTLGLYQSTTNTLGSGVSVGNLLVAGGSTATTTDSGNVTSTVIMAGGSTLNLGATMNLSGQLTASGTGTTINLNGNALNAFAVELGIAPNSGNPSGNPAATLDRGGAGGVLNVTGLLVSEGSLNLVAGDKILALEAVGNATLTTAATGNVTVDLLVAGGSKVNLGADLELTGTSPSLTVSGQLSIQDSGSALNAQGHAITADSFLVGQSGTSAVSVTNLGLVTVNTLEVGHGSSLTLHGGDAVSTTLSLTGNSTLTVEQTNGIGLTFSGSSASDLTIDPSTMNLVFTSTALNNWDFRWADPATGGNWVNTIDSLITAGEIKLSLLPGETYMVGDSGGYTYIFGVAGQAAVPEPSSLVLAGIATAGVAIAMKRRRRTGR
jgi:hypothetical protein